MNRRTSGIRDSLYTIGDIVFCLLAMFVVFLGGDILRADKTGTGTAESMSDSDAEHRIPARTCSLLPALEGPSSTLGPGDDVLLLTFDARAANAYAYPDWGQGAAPDSARLTELTSASEIADALTSLMDRMPNGGRLQGVKVVFAVTPDAQGKCWDALAALTALCQKENDPTQSPRLRSLFFVLRGEGGRTL